MQSAKTTALPQVFCRPNRLLELTVRQKRALRFMSPAKQYACATCSSELGVGLQSIRYLALRGLVRFIGDRKEGYEQWSSFSLTWAGVYVRRKLRWKPFHVAIREIQFVSVNTAAK